MKTATHTPSSRAVSRSRKSPAPGHRERRPQSQPVIAEVMTLQPFTIGRDQTLETAHRMMRENGVRHLPVLEHGEIVGILSQRDLYFLETMKGVEIEIDTVADAMTQDSYTVAPHAPLAEVAATMAGRRLGCAVVVDRDRVVGIFTATDALRLLSTEPHRLG